MLPTSVTSASVPLRAADDRVGQVVGGYGATTTSSGRSVAAFGATRAEPARSADVLGREVGQHDVDAGPATGQRDRRTDQAGADDLDQPQRWQSLIAGRRGSW